MSASMEEAKAPMVSGMPEEIGRIKSLRQRKGRESCQPRSTAGITSVNVGDGCKTWLEPPCVEKVNPVDVGSDCMYFIRQNGTHRLVESELLFI